VRNVPRLCEFYPGICLTTEGKKHAKSSVRVRKRNLTQGKKINDVTWLAGVKCLAVYFRVQRKITKGQADRCLGRVSKQPLY